MSKKHKQARAGTYALCITIGVIVGIGLAPVTNNLLITLIAGTVGGGVVGYLFDRRSMRAHRKHHAHHP